MLSLTNAAIDQAQKDVITGGLGGLAAWAQLLDEHDLASQLLPGVGRSSGEALDLGDILDQGLAQPIADYFAADSDPTTDELVLAIQGLNATSFDNVMLSVTNVTGGKQTKRSFAHWFIRPSLTNPIGPQGEANCFHFALRPDVQFLLRCRSDQRPLG
jgi:hypothetical protein